MADHQDRADIEEPQSAVLRLVPADLRVPGRAIADRLVLTPDLRVPPSADLPSPPTGDVALRELIREVLQEELQGAFGERITRNVRKLVLAEVRRALSLRDLD